MPQGREPKLEKGKDRRRFWFFGGDLRPDPPKPERILRPRGHPAIPEGRRPENVAGRSGGSQDKRIRKPKLEIGKDRKLRRKERKENNKMRFHCKY